MRAEHDLRGRDALVGHLDLGHRRRGRNTEGGKQGGGCNTRRHLLFPLQCRYCRQAVAARYMASISDRYFLFTKLRRSFMVGVSSSSSGVSCCSIRKKRLIVSTRAKLALT